MAIKVTYSDGSIQIIPRAARVDQHNYHEGMYDLYSEEGGLMEQISMNIQIKWEIVDEPETKQPSNLE